MLKKLYISGKFGHKNKISALAVQDPFRMGYTVVKNIVASIKGESFEADVDTGAVLLDLENIDSQKVKELLNPSEK